MSGMAGRTSSSRWPVALPPKGDYPVAVDGEPLSLRIEGGNAWLRGEMAGRRATVVLTPS